MSTAKQVLAQHVAERHRHHVPPKRATFTELGHWHAQEHHKYRTALDHWHGPQPSLGPGQRPDGWYDGTHVQERTG